MAARRMSKRGRLVLLAALAVLTAGLLLATGFSVGLLTLLPAIATIALILVWPDPGLDLILRLAARRASPRPRRARPPTRRRRSVGVRGGRLIAVSLGGRAPPALACRL